MVDDLEGISVFLAVAEARNFRLAGERLGVTRSAVSQALQRLEDRVGVALVQRTTRSVSLTEAGEVFFDAVRPSLRQVKDAMQTVREMQARPSGLLKITVSSIAESFLSGTLLAGFMKRASYRLAYRDEERVTDIAMGAGYNAPDAFARAFRQRFGQSPSSFRKSPDWEPWLAAFGPLNNARSKLMGGLQGSS